MKRGKANSITKPLPRERSGMNQDGSCICRYIIFWKGDNNNNDDDVDDDYDDDDHDDDNNK